MDATESAAVPGLVMKPRPATRPELVEICGTDVRIDTDLLARLEANDDVRRALLQLSSVRLFLAHPNRAVFNERARMFRAELRALIQAAGRAAVREWAGLEVS